MAFGAAQAGSLLDNLAREWASLPTFNGMGYYSGQNASASVMQVTAALSEVKRLHEAGQPKIEVPVAPEAVDKAVKQQTDGWGWSGIGIAGGLVALVVGLGIIRRVKAIRAEAAT